MSTMETPRSLGEIAYEAYWMKSEGRLHPGGIDPLPPFTDLAPPIRDAWQAAGEAVQAALDARHAPEEES